MRLHIRMHFDPKQADMPEESIISYIVAGEVDLPSGGLLAGLAEEKCTSSSTESGEVNGVEASPKNVDCDEEKGESDQGTAVSKSAADESSRIFSEASPEKNTKKFCKHCKIPFSNLSSFINHRKLHCPSRQENKC